MFMSNLCKLSENRGISKSLATSWTVLHEKYPNSKKIKVSANVLRLGGLEDVAKKIPTTSNSHLNNNYGV